VKNNKNRVYPVEKADELDSFLRRLFHNPKRILRSYLGTGMTALDLGCGIGYFTLPMAQMVGETGKVVAVDIQDGMLQRVKNRIDGTELEPRVVLHLCNERSLNYEHPVDFVLAFHVMHEIPNQPAALAEIASILQPGGQALIVEPPFHVSKADFAAMIENAHKVGLESSRGPRMIFDKTVVFTRV